jgi:hypothetical protein
MKKLIAVVLFFTSFGANADLTGASITGALEFGGGATNFWGLSPYSSTGPTTTIGSGVEYSFFDGANHDTADFSGTQLTIFDQVITGAGSWKMTFTTPGSFSSLSLVSSNFAPDFTYGLSGGQIVVDWSGTSTPGTYIAVFDVNVAAVPEPESYAMLLAGLGLLGFVARRRKQQEAA